MREGYTDLLLLPPDQARMIWKYVIPEARRDRIEELEKFAELIGSHVGNRVGEVVAQLFAAIPR